MAQPKTPKIAFEQVENDLDWFYVPLFLKIAYF